MLFTTLTYAAPKSLEVWFISNSKVTQINDYLNRPLYVFRPLTAELQCQMMGDYCFDPQYGLYKRDDSWDNHINAGKVEGSAGPKVPVATSIDRNMIDCDKNNYFDVFCGKAKPEVIKSKAKLDLWIDTSSSVREFDFEKDGGCHRKTLLNRLDQSCPFNQKVNVMVFDTSIKQMGSMEQACENQGLNDYKRLIDWIERNDSDRLVVITDIYEFHKEFADYVESKNGHFRGDKDPLTAAQMADLADDLAKSCK